MKNFKKLFPYFLFIYFIFNIEGKAANAPNSFADLADKLMPSVVNISTTQTITTTRNQFPFQFPPGSPFGEMFKDFERPTERKASSLGSGFIIEENGIVITNNHVVANAEDILVRVGEKEYEAKIIGADPYMDIAVIKMETRDKFKPVSFGDSSKKPERTTWFCAEQNRGFKKKKYNVSQGPPGVENPQKKTCPPKNV